MNTLDDDTLRAARERLLAREALLVDRVTRVRADLRREHDPLPVAVPEPRENVGVLQAIEKSACSEMARIEAALDRTQEGTFGLCAVCGLEIDAVRFAASPEATRCRNCERGS